MSKVDPSNWSKFVEDFKLKTRDASRSVALEDFRDKFVDADIFMVELISIVETFSVDEQPSKAYALQMLYAKTWKDLGGIPNWDTTFNPKTSYNEYEAYYQRFGCSDSDCLISWDTQSVLVHDGVSTPQMIMRPDVLMSSVN